MTYADCLAQTLIPGAIVEPAYGIRGTDAFARALWLEWRAKGIDRKDKEAMIPVAADYEKAIGVKAELIEVIPQYGPQKGIFQGYNIIESWR